MPKKKGFTVREKEAKKKIWRKTAKDEIISLNRLICRVMNEYCEKKSKGKL